MASVDQSNETCKSDSTSSSAVPAAAPPAYAPAAAYDHQEVGSGPAPRSRARKTSSADQSSQVTADNYARAPLDGHSSINEKEDGAVTRPGSLKTSTRHSMPRSAHYPHSPASPRPHTPAVNERIRNDVLSCMNSESQSAAAPEGGSGGDDASWKSFCYEHPLHAATSAMLNLSEGANGLGEEAAAAANVTNAASFHEQYLSKFQSGAPANAYASVHYPHKDAGKSPNDLWPAQHLSSDLSASHHKEFHQNSQMHQLSIGQDAFPVVVKKEPEDLTRRRDQHEKGGGGGGGGGGDAATTTRYNHEIIPRLETIPHTSLAPSGSVIQLRRSHAAHQGDVEASVAPALDLVRSPIAQYSSGNYNSGPVTSHNSAISTIHSIGMNHTYLSPSGSAYGFLAANESPLFASSSPTLLRSTQQAGSFNANLNQSSDPFYRDYIPSASNGDQFVRTPQASYQAEVHENGFVERFIRNHGAYKSHHVSGTNLSVDLPSPDSGIGVDAGTPREQSVVQPGFEYTELCQPNMSSNLDAIQESHALDLQEAQHHPDAEHRRGIIDDSRSAHSVDSKGSMSPSNSLNGSGRSRSWHECNRQSDVDKVQIPKLLNQNGFRYFLESPISTSQRREDDRITYINKGQFYGITLEYTPDPERPLKNQTVKSMVMVVFREEKTAEDEAKSWQFWHSRQHSAKQRILDADTKNSTGLVGCIEEVSHNAICIYWNPLESAAKINVAVQCLSTDFSSQKGVKGLPLHIQIDTFDDPRDAIPVFHRGYCQVKVFCDKGAERKTRDEERRAIKRKQVVTGRNKRLDELYHPTSERSEFYHMADLVKPPTLFTPADQEKMGPAMDMQAFYAHDVDRKEYIDPHACGSIPAPIPNLAPVANAAYPASVVKRRKTTPPAYERVMIYVRQENEVVFTPLHLVPPTTLGLMEAIESKYKISASNISSIYRRNVKGVLAKVDDEMLKHYCNEDLFILEITTSSNEGMYDITLKDLCDA